MVHCDLNKTKLAFDAQYKTAILSLLTYVVSDLRPDDHWPQRPLAWPWLWL